MKEKFHDRTYLIISTILSTTTFSLLIIVLPIVFVDVQNRKTFLTQIVQECEVNFFLNYNAKTNT